MRKLRNWYDALNTKQRWIIWGVTVAYALFPYTGVFGGGIPWAIVLLYLEFNRDGTSDSKK